MEGVHDLSFHSTDGEKGTKREEETKKKKLLNYAESSWVQQKPNRYDVQRNL